MELPALERSFDHLTTLYTARPELTHIRFDPERLAQHLGEYVDRHEEEATWAEDPRTADAQGDWEDDALHQEMMAEIVPSLVTPSFAEKTLRALERSLRDPQNTLKDVKALLTGIFFAEAEKKKIVPTAGNPLWSLTLSLSTGDLVERRQDLEGLVEGLQGAEAP